MATSRTAAMAEEQDRQSLASKPLDWIAAARQFWREVALEMKKVSWPTRTEVINTTIITIVVVFFFAAFLWQFQTWGSSYLIHGIEWLARKIFG